MIIYRPNIFGVRLGFTMSEKVFRAELKKMGIKEPTPFLLADAGATLHTYKTPHDRYFIMTLRPDMVKAPLDVAVGLCAHEATHVWQHIRDKIHEDKPGIETEAYFIQAVTQCFFIMFLEEKKKRK